jgi:ParB-like chromosome segregation protein Spo0J
MRQESSSSIEVSPSELHESFGALRLCVPGAQKEMERSLSREGQLTPVLAFRSGSVLEVFDGIKRTRAARRLSWATVRVYVHPVDAPGAKVGLLRSNEGTKLSELEEAWLIRSLYREDKLSQPQIAQLLSRHKSWVCRRLALAEGLCDELTAFVRLGLVSATMARELLRLPRGNQQEAATRASARGFTTRQTARLVDALLAAPPEEHARLLEQVAPSVHAEAPSRSSRSPGERLVADVLSMKRLAVRLHTQLLERSLESLGESACVLAASELSPLRAALCALTVTIESRLGGLKGLDDVI